MSHREYSQLRGPVQRVVTNWADAPDSEVSEQYVFDSAGAIRQWRKVRRQGGQTVEEWSQSMPSPRTDDCSTGVRADDVSALSSWTMPSLHGTGFGTFGAATAKTFFDERDVPMRTDFVDRRGSPVISVAYECDAQGRIIRASQGGEDAMFAVEFGYDGAGRVVETTVSFAGSPLHRTLDQYNAEGDVVQSTLDGETSHFRYSYDDRGNWIEKTVTAGGGYSRTYRREIEYFAQS